jgi:hypothetical protein
MDRTVLAAIIVAIGLGAGGWFIGSGFVHGRIETRYVTVKGVAEREVQADVALWPVRFVVADDDLGRARERSAESARQVYAFLAAHGIDAKQAELREFDVADTQANRYGGQPAARRYIVSQVIMVRSQQPEVVHAAAQKVSELLSAGVILSQEGYGAGGPTYLFTRLNDLKPAMIAEATASARAAATQFAKDSGSVLGGIRQANQGLFVILPRDQAPGVQEERQRLKTVRVVTTVEYLLRGS